jgi:D-alanyl-D-alanine carboxypeptidase
MTKPGLLDRLAQPRALAALLAAVMACIAVTAIPAEARRHRHHVRHHAYHHQFAHYRSVAREGGENGDRIVGEHRGFAAIVVDANSGRTLYSRNENELRHPASVTKVMTLYLLFEQLEKGRLRLDTPLMISTHAAMQAPSKLGLAPGETISVENAIKALVTKSANDIACAVAENIGGSEANFARLMTRKAHALGMSRTHYENASGLPDPAQVTSARDLAVLGRAIQDRFPRYYRYFSTHVFAYNGALHPNHNHLLGRVEGMDGIKTGYTRASGFNLLTSVRRDHHHIVAVVMGGVTAGARDRIMADLIEQNIYGGANVRTAAAITENSPAEEITTASAEADLSSSLGRAMERVAQVVTPRAADAPPEKAVDETPVVAEPAVTERRIAYAPEIDPEPLASLPPATPARGKAIVVALEKTEKTVKIEKLARNDNKPAPLFKATGDKTAPLARPAFVPGLIQKQVAQNLVDRKKTVVNKSLAGVADGSTTSRVMKSHDATLANVTTPSALRTASASTGAAPNGRPARAGWMIQIGAAENPEKANLLLARARTQLQGFPSNAKAFTEKVQKGNETLYRARFAGLEEQSAESTCKALKRSGFACFTTKN